MSNNQEKLNEQLFNVVADEKVSDEARLKKVKYLVRLGADANARALGIGKSILVFAKESKDEEVVKFLQDNGAIEIYPTKEEAERLGKQFWNDEGDLKSLGEIKELLKKGADVNAKNNLGDTALMVAASWGKLDVVKCLVEHGADLEAKDKAGQTVLIKAAINGQLDVVKYLTDNGADLDAKDGDGQTALMMAAYKGHLEVVKYLAELGVDLNTKDEYGNTALMMASYGGHKDVVEVLEAQVKKPVLECIKDGRIKSQISLRKIKFLIRLGADLNTKDEYGWTALMVASKYGQKEIVEMLVSNNADVNLKSNRGRTALMMASFYGHKEVVEVLLKGNADVNVRNDDGNTALMMASCSGHKDVVEVLEAHIKKQEENKVSDNKGFGGRLLGGR